MGLGDLGHTPAEGDAVRIKGGREPSAGLQEASRWSETAVNADCGVAPPSLLLSPLMLP